MIVKMPDGTRYELKTKSSYRESILALVLVLAICYVALAAQVFRWRNPIANDMALYQNAGAVLRFEKLAEFQPKATND